MNDGPQYAVVPARLVRDDRIPAGAKAVAMALALYTNDLGVCWPSRKRLAADLGVSVDSIDRGLAALVEHGWLVKLVRVRPGSGDRASNAYVWRADLSLEECERRANASLDQRGLPPTVGVAADLRPPPQPHESGEGGGTDAATVAAPARPQERVQGTGQETAAAGTLTDRRPLLERFTPEQLPVVEARLRASRDPGAVALYLAGLFDGLGSPGGKAWTADEIHEALLDVAVAGAPFSPVVFGKFLTGLTSKREAAAVRGGMPARVGDSVDPSTWLEMRNAEREATSEP